MKRQIDNVGFAHTSDVPMKRWEKPAVRRVSFGNEVTAMAVLSLVFGAMVGAGWQYGWTWMLVAGIVALFGLWTAYAIYLVRTTSVAIEKIEFQDVVSKKEPVAEDPGRVAIPGNDGRSVEFMQPKPGEFASWAQTVIKDGRNGNLTFREKRQLSQNTGVRRGWPTDMYKSMLASLRSVGWVRTGKNSTPVLTAYGSDCIEAWLFGTTPPPPSSQAR